MGLFTELEEVNKKLEDNHKQIVIELHKQIQILMKECKIHEDKWKMYEKNCFDWAKEVNIDLVVKDGNCIDILVHELIKRVKNGL